MAKNLLFPILFMIAQFTRAQSDPEIVDVSPSIRTGSIACESDGEATVTYDSFFTLVGISPYDYHYTRGTSRPCNDTDWNATSVQNESLKWEDGGGNLLRFDPLQPNIAYVTLRPGSSGYLKVSWSSTTYYAASDCNEAYSVTKRYIGLKKFTVVPKSQPPTISADKSVVYSGFRTLPGGGNAANETVTLKGSGCPASTSEYNFGYRFYFAPGDCDAPSADAYNQVATGTDTWEASLAYDNNYYFQVKCSSDICGVSEQPFSANTAKVRGISKAVVPAPNCNQGEVAESQNQNGLDYHDYKVIQDVCDKSDADCTVQKVFELLISKQKLSVPQKEDFTDFTNNQTSKLSESSFLEPAIISVGMLVDGYERLTPTSHCGQSAVYSPSSYLFALKPIGGIGISNFGFLWDPITQGIHESSKTVTNYTLPGHALHPGKVAISVKEDGCKVFIQIVGSGNSDLPGPIGTFMSRIVNVDAGMKAFPNLMKRMKTYYDSKSWK